MKALLSFKMWLILLERIFSAIYPAELVLLPFSWKSFKLVKTSPIMRLLILFLIIDLGVRTLLFFTGIPFSQRYFFPFAVTVAIIAASGLIPLVNIISEKILKTTSATQKFTIYALLIIIIGVSYSLKAINPRNDKPWLQVIPVAIKTLTPENKIPVIISNKLDERFGYYAGTTELYKIYPKKNWQLMKKIKTETYSKWSPLDKKRGIQNLADKINQIGSDRVFIILKVEKSGTSKADVELNKELRGLHLTGTFTDRKKRVLKLYVVKKEGTGSGKNK